VVGVGVEVEVDPDPDPDPDPALPLLTLPLLPPKAVAELSVTVDAPQALSSGDMPKTADAYMNDLSLRQRAGDLAIIEPPASYRLRASAQYQTLREAFCQLRR
jgi:hypothetical protein